MKRGILFFLSGTLLSLSAIAQIPNNGFENWTSAGSYQNPDNWDNLNAMTSSMSVYTCTKGTPGSPGASYLKLVSKNVSGMGVMPGIATTGTINVGNMQVYGGFAYTQRPQSLTGSWQYMAAGNDMGFISVYLTKWNNNTRDTIAFCTQKLTGMVMSWATFTINLTYLSGGIPDTAQIILSASGTTPVTNSYLYVDDLAFSGSVAAVKENNCIDHLYVYPNPSRDKISVEMHLNKEGLVKVQVIDISGNIVSELAENSGPGTFNRTVELKDLARGIYFIKVNSDNQTEVRKIIVE